MERWSRILAEVALVLIPAAATAGFLFIDLWSIQIAGRAVDWRWWALASFGVFCLVIIMDFGRLFQRIRDLERGTCSLEIIHKTGLHPYFQIEGGYHRIGVYNHGPADADGVEVMLQDIVPHTPRTHLAFNVLPSRLGHKGGYCREKTGHCVINPQIEHHFDVVCDMRKGLFWGLQTQEFINTQLTMEEGSPCFLILVVTARNTRKRVTRYLELYQEKGGGLTVTLHEQAPDMADLATPGVPCQSGDRSA